MRKPQYTIILKTLDSHVDAKAGGLTGVAGARHGRFDRDFQATPDKKNLKMGQQWTRIPQHPPRRRMLPLRRQRRSR
jgi:hypothetical protein